uniref:Uncharacterized protein n=1 Tax=Stomoxys calcitrans TaxID=35570 RepID=A0A1I8PAW9_STOCA
MLELRNILKIVIVCGLHYITLGLRPHKIEIDAFRCEFNPNITKVFTIKMIESKDRNKLNGSFGFTQDMYALNVVNWLTFGGANGKQQRMYNVTANACQYLDKSIGSVNPFLLSVFALMRKTISDFPPRCPAKKDEIYSMLNFYIDEEQLPPYLPRNFKYNVFFGVLHKSKYAFKVFIDGHTEDRLPKKN